MLRQDVVGFLEESFQATLVATAESGLIAVAFGHRETERPFVFQVAKLPRARFPDVTVEER